MGIAQQTTRGVDRPLLLMTESTDCRVGEGMEVMRYAGRRLGVGAKWQLGVQLVKGMPGTEAWRMGSAESADRV